MVMPEKGSPKWALLSALPSPGWAPVFILTTLVMLGEFYVYAVFV